MSTCIYIFWKPTSPAPSFLARSILIPWGAATTTLQPPFCRSIWARLFGFSVKPSIEFFIETHTNPVGPAPNIRTDDPILGEILSSPCAAQDAGSSYFLSEHIQLDNKQRPTYKGGVNIRKIVNLEDLSGRICTVLGKAAVCTMLGSCSV
jgi:hypothetical protein